MDTSMRTNGWVLQLVGSLAALVMLGAGVVGCVGGDPSGATAIDATLVLADAEPLAAIGPDAWSAAPGCEGLLARGVSFRVASLSGGLVACVDSSGRVVCVDSVEAISSDLDESGRDAEADALAAGFVAAVHAQELARTVSGMTSDPEPQPNTRPRGIGDPEPQPN